MASQKQQLDFGAPKWHGKGFSPSAREKRGRLEGVRRGGACRGPGARGVNVRGGFGAKREGGKEP